jgi:hypothetical protein
LFCFGKAWGTAWPFWMGGWAVEAAEVAEAC